MISGSVGKPYQHDSRSARAEEKKKKKKEKTCVTRPVDGECFSRVQRLVEVVVGREKGKEKEIARAVSPAPDKREERGKEREGKEPTVFDPCRTSARGLLPFPPPPPPTKRERERPIRHRRNEAVSVQHDLSQKRGGGESKGRILEEERKFDLGFNHHVFLSASRENGKGEGKERRARGSGRLAVYSARQFSAKEKKGEGDGMGTGGRLGFVCHALISLFRPIPCVERKKGEKKKKKKKNAFYMLFVK